MARLASQEKMGYYVTPEETLKFLAEKVRISTEAVLLDPCCGEGRALERLVAMAPRSDLSARPWEENIGTYGIEVDSVRAAMAMGCLDTALAGSIYDAVVRPSGRFSLLYLNPPYEYEDGERMEFKFLRKANSWLMAGGVLIFLVPEHVLGIEKVKDWISRRYRDMRVYRFTKGDYPVFKQVALFAEKRKHEAEAGLGETIPVGRPWIEDTVGDHVYQVPAAIRPEVFEMKTMTADEIIARWAETVANIKKATGMATITAAPRAMSPLLPLRKGHLISLLMSGVLNGRLTDDVVFKCFTKRNRIENETTDEEGVTKKITLDTYVSGIRVIERGAWYDVT